MSDGDPTFCRACSEPIIWRKHQRTLKLAPLDAAPVVDGNIIEDGEFYSIAGSDYGPDERRHKNHFATCPQATRFR